MKKEKSWEYDDENNIYAVKSLDKSSFIRGSHIPINVRKVFECEDVEYGGKKEIKLIYEGNVYDAYIEREKRNKIRMVWTSIIPKMKQVFKNEINDFNDSDGLKLRIPKLKFQKEDPKKYTIDMKTQYNDEIIRGLEQLNIDITKENEDIGEVIERIIKARKNQYKFRKSLLNESKECRICGINNEILLKASHIKAWRFSTAQEKLDKNNGFLLCPNHDELFDKYLISFKDTGEIIISKKLGKDDKEKMGINDNTNIRIDEANKIFLKEHRKTFYELEKKYDIENKLGVNLKEIENYNIYNIKVMMDE